MAYERKLEKDIRCPLEYGMALFGGKWKSRILCVLAGQGTLRYSALRKQMGNITDAVLAAALKELLADDMIQRRSYDEIPPRVEYALSELGESMRPVMDAMEKWGINYKNQLQTK